MENCASGTDSAWKRLKKFSGAALKGIIHRENTNSWPAPESLVPTATGALARDRDISMAMQYFKLNLIYLLRHRKQCINAASDFFFPRELVLPPLYYPKEQITSLCFYCRLISLNLKQAVVTYPRLYPVLWLLGIFYKLMHKTTEAALSASDSLA